MKKQRTVHLYSYLITAIGVVFLAAKIPENTSPFVLVGLTVLTFLGEFNSVRLSSGQVSPVHAITAFVYFTHGLETAVWVVVWGTLVFYLVEQYYIEKTRGRVHRLLFNSCQYGIALVGTHPVLELAEPFLSSLSYLPLIILRVVLFSIFFMLLNHMLVNFYIWLENSRTLNGRFVLEALRWDSAIYGFSLMFIVLMIELYRVWGIPGFLFFYIPLLVVGKGFQSYHHYFTALRELTTLYDITTILWSTLDREEVVKRVANAVQQLTNAELVRIYLLDEEAGQYCLGAVLGEYARLEQVGTCYISSDGLIGQALKQRETITLRGGEYLAEYGDQFAVFEAAVVVPMVHRGTVYGAIVLNSTRANAIRTNVVRLLEMLAHYSAFALCNAMMFSEARRQTIIDQLTGLYNYYFFSSKIVDTVDASKRSGECFSLIMIDIDKFKTINDSLGHEAGNHVLAQLAAVLRAHVRSSDVVARFGGEEFVVILPGAEKEVAVEVAERLRQAVSDSVFTLPDRNVSVRITISLGVATYPDDALSQHELVDAADRALYGLAKEQGRNRVGVA